MLKEYKIVGAKDRLEVYEGGQDLQVAFVDVRFDVETYALYAAIVVFDSKTGTELVKLPKRYYRGGHFSVISCLNGDLDKLAQRVAKEIRQLRKTAK